MEEKKKSDKVTRNHDAWIEQSGNDNTMHKRIFKTIS